MTSIASLLLALSFAGTPLRPVPADPRIVQFAPMVKKLARSYYRSRIALSHAIEDLEQEGFRGLVDAIEKFEPDRGMAFSSFAWKLINEALIRVKTHCSRGMRSIANASLSSAGPDDEPWEFASPVRSPEELADVSICSAELRPFVAALSNRQREVLRLRFWEGETLEEIGDRLDLTRERVRQIQDDAIAKLRRSLRREQTIAMSHKSTRAQLIAADKFGALVHLSSSRVAPVSPTLEGARRDG